MDEVIELEEAAEIVTEIRTEVTEVATEMTEELEVVSEATEATETSLNINEEVDEVVENIHGDYVTDLLKDDPALTTSFKTEVESVTTKMETELEDLEEIPREQRGAECGSGVSQSTAEQRAVADKVAGKGGRFATLKKVGGVTKHVLEGFIFLDIVGKAIAEIIFAIKDSLKKPSWKGSLTEKQKAQLKRLQAAIGTLKPVLEGWEKALKPLEENTSISYGSMTTNAGGKEHVVQVIDVVAHLIQDATIQLQEAKESVKDGIDGLSVFDLTQLSNYIFAAFADAQALINLRDNKGNIVTDDKLALFKFPPEGDDKEVNKVLVNSFPQWQEMVNSQGFTLAKMGASMAIGAFSKSQIILKVNSYLRENIYPKIKDAAKEAGIKAATDHINNHKGTIIAKALIPIVGPQQAREYGKKLQTEAIKLAQEAAQKAGTTRANELKDTIKSNLKPIMQEIIDDNKESIKEIGKYAAQQILNTVNLPDATRP